jgi:hypothetical protein
LTAPAPLGSKHLASAIQQGPPPCPPTAASHAAAPTPPALSKLPPSPTFSGLGAVAVVPLSGGRRLAASRFPDRRQGSKRTDLRFFALAARFDQQRGRPRRPGASSMLPFPGRPRLLHLFGRESRQRLLSSRAPSSVAPTPPASPGRRGSRIQPGRPSTHRPPFGGREAGELQVSAPRPADAARIPDPARPATPEAGVGKRPASPGRTVPPTSPQAPLRTQCSCPRFCDQVGWEGYAHTTSRPGGLSGGCAAVTADIPALFSVSAPHITGATRTTAPLRLGAAA